MCIAKLCLFDFDPGPRTGNGRLLSGSLGFYGFILHHWAHIVGPKRGLVRIKLLPVCRTSVVSVVTVTNHLERRKG